MVLCVKVVLQDRHAGVSHRQNPMEMTKSKIGAERGIHVDYLFFLGQHLSHKVFFFVSAKQVKLIKFLSSMEHHSCVLQTSGLTSPASAIVILFGKLATATLDLLLSFFVCFAWVSLVFANSILQTKTSAWIMNGKSSSILPLEEEVLGTHRDLLRCIGVLLLQLSDDV